jgi:integrase
MLTDTAIRTAVREAVRRKVFDSQGLFLLIDPPRRPGWRLKYRIAGREKLLSLGVYPDVSLKRAREKRDDARRLIADGTDPSLERKAERHSHAHTLKLVAAEWFAMQKHLTAGTIQRDRDRLAKYIFPNVGALPIASITAPQILAALKRIEARGTYETAQRTRSALSRVFRYAVTTGRAERDPCQDLRGALISPVTKSFAAIVEPARIGELLRAIDGYSGQPATHAALKLAPLVFVRPGELRAAVWSEFDLEGAQWRIPASRMKSRAPHLVPLSTQAVAILRDLEALTGDGKYLFPSLRTAAKPISDNTINAALRRMGYSKEEMTGHGFRSIASTLLNEQGFAPDVIELQLAHRDGSVRAVYNRSQRLAERRAMMQAWSNYLDVLRDGGAAKVTSIHSGQQVA